MATPKALHYLDREPGKDRSAIVACGRCVPLYSGHRVTNEPERVTCGACKRRMPHMIAQAPAARRELTEADVTFTITAEQDDIPVRGNALASGDAEMDKKYEDEIIDRLNRGDVWAWASVRVRASWRGHHGDDYLGGCCYESEKDFSAPDGYLPQMKRAALDELNASIDRAEKDAADVRAGKAGEAR